ncbi:MAG TPA: hypothetical protein VGS22_03070 [Thermoanaerobaculia bacterium]|jgi:hypothetical protein|nr:hypothetical protein [Thermoanaerobaculia bacterium]
MASHALRALQRILQEAEGTPADPRTGSDAFASPGRENFTLDDFSLDTGALLERLTRAGEVLERERQELGLLLGEIFDTPPAERPARLNEARFESYSLADALLAQFETLTENDSELGQGDAAFEETGDLCELPSLALQIANRLDLARHPPAMIEDLKARVWTALGDAHLRSGDPESAEHALREGVKNLVRGSGDLLIEARMLELEADLRFDSGMTLEADALLRQATAHLREARQTGQLARLAAKRRRVAEQAQAARAMTGLLPHSRR